MKRALTIQQDLSQIHTIEDLTGVFESIASIKIAKIRNRVVASKQFFAEFWQTYSGLRIDPRQRMSRRRHTAQKDVFIAVTAEGKLSGNVDEQIIAAMIDAKGSRKDVDLMVIGMHGVSQMQQRKVRPIKSFHMPAGDDGISVSDVIAELGAYNQIVVFYQTYESLRVQRIVRLELTSAVRELGESVEDDDTVVSSRDYIFEPSVDVIADYMESVMLGVALIQVIMESKLAQYANRFNTMSAGKRRATELAAEYRRSYYRAKRSEGDERLKEIMKVVQVRG